jgi:HEAT repeat protein
MAIVLLILTAFAPFIAAGQTAAQTEPAALPGIEDILKQLATYEFGQKENILWQLRNYVRAHKDDPAARLACEEKLAGFLESNATLPGKMTVCRELRLIGGEKSVPALAKMLLQKDTSDMARYALEKIPGGSAEQALIQALSAAEGEIRLGIIATLGGRKSAKAVPALDPMLTGLGPEVGAAAADALGRIGGQEAADALLKALPAAQPDGKNACSSALLKIAAEFKAAKNFAAASPLYATIASESVPPLFRHMAMAGKIGCAGDKAPGLILEILSGPDENLQAAAIAMVKEFYDSTALGPICAALPALPEANQVKLLAVLAEYPNEAALKTALEAAKSPSKDVRIAALKALEKTGDASTVPFLAVRAAATMALEQTAARTALWGLKGEEVDAAILSLLESRPDDKTQAELVRSVGERRVFAGKSLLMKIADSGSARARSLAVRAMKTIGTPSDVPGMLELLFKYDSESNRQDIENTIAGLAQKMSRPDTRAGAVASRLSTEKDPQKRAILYRVLGRIGDDSSLALLRAASQDKNPDVADAATRAIIDWPTSTAKDDVFEIAAQSANTTHKILALRAFIRMTGLEKYRSPKFAVDDLQKALKIAKRPEEKKLILSILPDFAGPDALRLAEKLQKDKNAGAEAKVALVKIKSELKKT